MEYKSPQENKNKTKIIRSESVNRKFSTKFNQIYYCFQTLLLYLVLDGKAEFICLSIPSAKCKGRRFHRQRKARAGKIILFFYLNHQGHDCRSGGGGGGRRGGVGGSGGERK